MADFNTKAIFLYEHMKEEEQEKALSFLKSLEGLEVGRADSILEFCKESIKTKAVVKL